MNEDNDQPEYPHHTCQQCEIEFDTPECPMCSTEHFHYRNNLMLNCGYQR